MGTEIVIITMWQLCILVYSVVVRIVRLAVTKKLIVQQQMHPVYKYHAVFVLIISLLPSLLFLWAISDDYGFVIGYILIIQTPIILFTLWALMPLCNWLNLTKRSTRTP